MLGTGTGGSASATEIKKRNKRNKKLRKARIGIMATQAFELPHYSEQSQEGIFRPTHDFYRVPQYMNNAPQFTQSVAGQSMPYVPSPVGPPVGRLPYLSQSLSRSVGGTQPFGSQLPPVRQSRAMSIDARIYWTAPGTAAAGMIPPKSLRGSSVLDISSVGNPSDVEHTELND